MTRRDMQLVRRAFKNHWDVPAEKRCEIVAQLRQVIDNPNSSARDKSKAVETLNVITATKAI